jgi:hypothetical protein
MNQEQKIIQIEENIIQRQKEIQKTRESRMISIYERLEKDADKIMDKLEEDILKTIAMDRMRHPNYYSNDISYFLDRYQYHSNSYHRSLYIYKYDYGATSMSYDAPKILKKHKHKFKVLSSQCVNLLSNHYKNYLISELEKRNLTIYFADESKFRYFVELDMYIVDPEFIRQAEIRKQNKRCIIL